MDSILPDSTQSKQCKTCNKWFPATPEYFQRNRGMRDGLLLHCKSCCSTAKPKEIIPDGFKKCSKCKELKPATNDFFTTHGRDANNLYSQCFECVHQTYRKKHPKPAMPVIPEGHKRCTKCQEVKPFADFYTNGKKGPTAWCKHCIKDQRKNNVPVVTRDFKRCTQCLVEYPATIKFFPKRKASPDGLETRCRTCHNKIVNVNHRARQEHINQKQRERRSATREDFNEQSKVYYHKRKALKKGNGGTYTVQEIRDQLVRQKYKCYYCHDKFEKVHVESKSKVKYIYHIEHVVPIARGGSNDIWNIVLACPTCNMRKHDKLPHEWTEGGRLL